MKQREVISSTLTRWSQVVPNQGGWSVRCGIPGVCASECFFLDEQLAHDAAKRWEREGVEPRGPETRTDWPAVTAEQLEANRG